MDSLAHFLRDLATVLMAAGLVVVLFQRLRWPLVAGYLVAGVLVGPHVPPALVADQGIIQLLAELGVVLLMFSLGLDFRVARLLRVASTAGLAATVEIGLMLALGYAAGQALGWTPVASLFAGGIVAISSTMIVAKVFAEQRVEARLRDAVLGILIFEDLAAILLIAVLTAAATRGQVSQQALGQLLLRLGLFLLLFLSLGQLLVPRLVRLVAGQHRAETLVVTAVGLCFGLAWLAQAAGFSVALGAFLAGVLAAESGLSRLVEDQVRPVRDVFAAIFFVAVGMQLDPAVLASSWPVVLLFGALVIGGKTLGVSLGSFLAGASPRDSVQAGLSLAQIGEFSFIIAGIGVTLGAAHPGLIGIAVTVSTVTAFLSPVLIRRSAGIAAWVDRRLPHQVQTVASLYGSWIEQLRAPHPGPSPWRRVRGHVRWLLLDAALVFAVVVLGNYAREPLTGLTQRIGVPAPATSFVVGAAVLAAVAPFLVGIIRVAHDLARELATIAVPLPPPH
ncbi:MAG TPA: cation:proton antiporter, partial [Gemmatimonadales bacterium]|nr:cation:proton antiporter [Gemmatimonadales bacterium]